jgi:cellulose synthase/poly-beta-1,6-N-acetylglucosamine synthase-like glycosyltransferase
MLSTAFAADALLVLYFAVLTTLAIFGIHRYRMVYLYFRNREVAAAPRAAFERLPRVTVQLPLYNELYVVERLIDSVSRIEYPRELLEIQVLDDSTDETASRARARVAFHRERGIDIQYLRRPDRTGFKAGALAFGLAGARGEILAIFDADFVPEPDFLERTVHHFTDPEVGMVQARWGHINDGYSLLTRIQAVLLDAHFVLEHGGRSRSGAFFNFNGTAGLWRREAIEKAGGWQHDTLTEDMDLSYRAQLAGYRFVFLPEVVAPAEIPVSMAAFKSQQQRWAKGSIETARKLLPRILASPLPLRVKVEALFHLTANLAYPLMALLSLLMFPAMQVRFDMGFSEMLLLDVPLFLAATASVTSFYVVSQRELYPDWRRRLTVLPMLLALGIGMCLSNGRAVMEALFGRDSEFVRTPKYRIESVRDGWKRKRYRGRSGPLPWLEVALGLSFTAASVYAAANQIFGSIPFLVLFQAGFLYTGILSLRESFDLASVRLLACGEAPVINSFAERA